MKAELAPLEDIVAAASRIGRFVAGLNHAAFMENEEKQSAIFGQVIIIGEAATRLPESFLDAHSEVPWRQMMGMRNRIVHGNDEIDWDIVWPVAVDEIPALIHLLSPLLAQGHRDR